MTTPTTVTPSPTIDSLLLDAYRDALAVQNTSNLSGVLRTWVSHQPALFTEADRQGHGSDWIHHHPINILFASKVAALTGCESPAFFQQAWQDAIEATR